MMATSARRRGVAGLGIVTALILALLLGLGFWQLQRRVEKHALIAALTERLAASPGALPPATQWSALTSANDEFRRVRFLATFEARPDAMVYSSGSAVRTDISGPGTWAFMPAQLPEGGTVVVNTGFVQNTMQDRALQDGAVAGLMTGAPAMLTGYLRFPEAAGLLTPQENLGKRLWFTRDHVTMAQKLGWDQAGRVAPFYVDLEQPVPENGTPKPGPLEVHLKDDHLQYAITWFALAGAVMIAFGVWWRGQSPKFASRRDTPA
jgi:surfeit locus 1 family protein